jgi:hypothetical protein
MQVLVIPTKLIRKWTFQENGFSRDMDFPKSMNYFLTFKRNTLSRRKLKVPDAAERGHGLS